MKEPVVNNTRFSSNLNNVAFLVFILMVGPIAWLLDLFLKFVLASNACLHPGPSQKWFFDPSAFTVIDLVAISATAIAMWGAYRSWNATTPKGGNRFHAVTEIGESRQHFLALWGILIGAIFISAIVFSFVVNLAVHPCTS